MEKSTSWRITPPYESDVLVISLFAFVTLAFMIPGLAQTGAQPELSKPQQNGSLAAPSPSGKAPAKTAGQHRLVKKTGASRRAQSQSTICRRFGPSLDSWRVAPDAMPHSIYDLRVADLERQMWVLINRDRSNPEASAETGGGAQPLKWNDGLAAVARAHSRNMLVQQFFSHSDPQGRTYEMRVDQAGIPWWAAGENIAIDDTIQRAESALMNEARFQPNHRYNILNKFYTDVGIGIVKGPDGSLYITQDFTQAPPHRADAGSNP